MSESESPVDRTIIMPAAGRRRLVEEVAADNSDDPAGILAAATRVWSNPLIAAAAPLLATAASFREMPRHDDPMGLRNALIQSVKAFEERCRAAQVPPERIVAGRYLLCTFMDEAAANTPWGANGVWAAQSLLVFFHNETSGGEKSFQLLGKLAENIPANLPLLELFHVVLALGFQGRYRVVQGGAAQLESVRQRLWTMLQTNAASRDADLSPRWASTLGKDRGKRETPVWVIASLAALGLLVLFALLLFGLNRASDPVFTALESLHAPDYAETAQVPQPPPRPAAKVVRLAQLLQPEIQGGLLTVDDRADRSLVSLKGDGVFAAGSADVSSAAVPLLQRVAEALRQVPGRVVVAGHTDAQPIRTLRFPSNWHLSNARAQSVASMLAPVIGAQRISAEGRSDSEPVAANTSAEGRAQNRRVDVVLYPSAGGAP